MEETHLVTETTPGSNGRGGSNGFNRMGQKATHVSSTLLRISSSVGVLERFGRFSILAISGSRSEMVVLRLPRFRRGGATGPSAGFGPSRPVASNAGSLPFDFLRRTGATGSGAACASVLHNRCHRPAGRHGRLEAVARQVYRRGKSRGNQRARGAKLLGPDTWHVDADTCKKCQSNNNTRL